MARSKLFDEYKTKVKEGLIRPLDDKLVAKIDRL